MATRAARAARKAQRRTQVEMHARILRALCEIIETGKKATVGQVERTTNVEAAQRKDVEKILKDFHCAGIVEMVAFDYRPGKPSKHYLFVQTDAVERFVKAQLRWLKSRIEEGSAK